MAATTIRRSVALVASAAILASLAVATVAAPASAAKPRCAGKTATIVGTAKGEVIRGTNKADVIVARGGNDRIYGRGGNDIICGGGGNDRILGAGGKDVLLGQGGRDKLYGGAGRDRLLGGPANDRLAGGPGNDACLQGSGVGLRLSCERPVAPLPPTPTPTPAPAPTPTPVPKLLAIAYTDTNGNHTFESGDVMIAKLVDTSGDGVPSAGDTIKMGRYPTKPDASDFADWGVTSHTVDSVNTSADFLRANSATGYHIWQRLAGSIPDQYYEVLNATVARSDVYDGPAGNINTVRFDAGTPSQPTTTVPYTTIPSGGDDKLIDVEMYY